MERIEFAATLRIAEILPVGGFVALRPGEAGAGKARLLDEGFPQYVAIGIAGVSINCQAPADQRGTREAGVLQRIDGRMRVHFPR